MKDIKELYDVVVIGGGPAGLTAALYLARARYRVVVVEKEHFGGQITITDEVVNFPGVERTSGKALTETMRRQAQSFGAEFLLAEVTGLAMDGDVKTVQTSRGELHCFGVLLATGAHPRSVGFAGEAEFKGRGVAYCATCDGEFFTGKEVFVVGGGFAAAEESVFLTKYARHVTILIRGDGFYLCPGCRGSGASPRKDHGGHPCAGRRGIRKGWPQSPEVSEYGNRGGYGIQSRRRGFRSVYSYLLGYEPATGLVKGLAECDAQGYVVTDRNQKTTCEGLYAAGDVCIKPLRQVVTAVGDGALAATELERYAAALQKKTGLYPVQPTAIAKEDEAAQKNGQADGWTVHAGYAIPAGDGVSKNGFPAEAEALSGRNTLIC